MLITYPSLLLLALSIICILIMMVLFMVQLFGRFRAEKIFRVLLLSFIILLFYLLIFKIPMTAFRFPDDINTIQWLSAELYGESVAVMFLFLCSIGLLAYTNKFLWKTCLLNLVSSHKQPLADSRFLFQKHAKKKIGLILLLKEWRLIYRDPDLLTQLILLGLTLSFAPAVFIKSFCPLDYKSVSFCILLAANVLSGSLSLADHRMREII